MAGWRTQDLLGGTSDWWSKNNEELLKGTRPLLEALKALQHQTDLTSGARIAKLINEQIGIDTSKLMQQLAPSMDVFHGMIAEQFMLSSTPAWKILQEQVTATAQCPDALKTDEVLKQRNNLLSNLAADTAKRVGKVQRFALPSNLWNLDDDLSIRNIRTFLNEDPYPVYNVPRAAIVNAFIKAESPTQRRVLLGSKANQITTDCEAALDNLDQESFKDELEQVRQSIEAYRCNLVRPSQTGLTIVLDWLFTRAMKLKTIRTEVKNQSDLGVEALAKLQTTDFLVWAPVRQAHLEFDRSKNEPPPRRYTRHGTVHSVQKRQYSKRNVIYALMVVTSLMTWLDERKK